MEKKVVKVRKKVRDEEGGKKIRKRWKATMYNESKKNDNDLEEVVIYTKEIKEKKERKVKKTYLVWLMTYLKTFACSTFV